MDDEERVCSTPHDLIASLTILCFTGYTSICIYRQNQIQIPRVYTGPWHMQKYARSPNSDAYTCCRSRWDVNHADQDMAYQIQKRRHPQETYGRRCIQGAISSDDKTPAHPCIYPMRWRRDSRSQWNRNPGQFR